MLTQDEKSELREKFLNILEALPTTPIKRIGQVITIFKVQELSGAMFMDSVKGMSFSTNLVLLYYFCFFFFLLLVLFVTGVHVSITSTKLVYW